MNPSPPLTLSTAPLEHPALDYAFLRQEGIRWLEKLTGDEWSDFNTHDPGITILEQLCYALTDLGHRSQYELPDLLTRVGEETYSALDDPTQMLTTRPVTLTDLRKLVIAVAGVKNAWVEKVTAQPTPFYDAEAQALTLSSPTPSAEPVAIQGLVRVLIEIADHLYLDSSVQADVVRRTVTQRLHANRGLGEDYAEIRVLPPQWVRVAARLEIDAVTDAEALLLAIYQQLADHISPPLRFASVSEQLAAGNAVEDVLQGPWLQRGVLADGELQQAQRRTVLRASDLIQTLMDVPGVRAVRTLTMQVDGGEAQPWSLPLSAEMAPKFDFDPTHSPIVLARNGLPVQINADKVQALYAECLRRSAHQPPIATHGLQPPPGRDRNVANYHSIQHHFPAVYGIGALGLPPSASPQRQAQAQQLKAYLLLFDQLLANGFAQLAGVKDLLTATSNTPYTYAARAVTDPQLGLDPLRPPLAEHQTRLQQITENPHAVLATAQAPDPQAAQAAAVSYSALQRRNRFLDHLLARYAEQLTDYALLVERGSSAASALAADLAAERSLVEDKQAFLQEYSAISAGRGCAANYLEAPSAVNRSGLEKRIERLLGLRAADGEIFYLVEHLLLRPVTEDKAQQEPLLAAAQRADPYSLQVSFVFPMDAGRFQNAEFRTFTERTVRAETPAHLIPYLHWLDAAALRDFQQAHTTWLNERQAVRSASVAEPPGGQS